MVECSAISTSCPDLHVNSNERSTDSFPRMRDELLRFLTRQTGRPAAGDVLRDVWFTQRGRTDPASWREPGPVLSITAAYLATDGGSPNATEERHLSDEAAARRDNHASGRPT
jgi:hypothetical protein